MMHPPTVVAVDDTPHELDAIVTALRLLDVACLPIHAKGTVLDLAAPLSGARLIFFDINYLPGVNTQTQRFEIAATVLQKIIAPDNGPYVLVTWTSKPEEHEALMAFFAKDVPEIPAPAMTACLSKEHFVVVGADAGAGAGGGSSLQQAVDQVLKQRPQVNALLEWEMSARRAAGEVVCSILSLFTREQRFANAYGTQMESLLAHMASCAVGSDNVATDRRAAINEAFAPVLFDRMIHSAARAGESELWEQAVTLASKLTVPDDSQKHRLNALSHIAFSHSGPMDAGDRGVVFNLTPSVAQYMSAKSGKSELELAAEFVVRTTTTKPVPLTTEDLTPACRWVMIGLRAVCDQAQNHGVLKPAVLGLEVPASAVGKGVGLKVRQHGAMFQTPVFEPEAGRGFEAGGRVIIVNWHWVISLGPGELSDAVILYRMREAAMNELSSSVSDYSSRPGIINFTDKYKFN